MGIPTTVRNIIRLLNHAASMLARHLLPSVVYRCYRRRFATPEILYVACTNVCNARCVFCIYRKELPRPQIMDMASFQRVVGEFEAMGGRCLGLTPTLGDPLLDPHLAERLAYLEGHKITDVKFFTNLLGLRDEHLQALEAIDTYRIWITISICGTNREDYKRLMGVDHFELLKDNLRRLSGLKSRCVHKNLFLRTAGERDPLDSDLGRFLLSNTVFGSKASPHNNLVCVLDQYDNWGGAVEAELEEHGLRKVMRKKKRIGICAQTFLKPMVESSGDLTLCECRDTHGRLVVGSIHEHSLQELWRGKQADEARMKFQNADSLPKVCLECTLYSSIYSPLTWYFSRRDAIHADKVFYEKCYSEGSSR